MPRGLGLTLGCTPPPPPVHPQCSCTSREPSAFAAGFPYFGTAAHLSEHALDTHCVPGRDKGPALAQLGVRNRPENHSPRAKSRPPPDFFFFTLTCFFFFFQIASLRSSSHIMTFTIVKAHVVQWFPVLSRGCTPITTV